MIGGDAHPFYRWVAAQLGEAGAPRWNFHKYLIGPEGQLAGAWPSQVGPTDPAITGEIEGHAADARKPGSQTGPVCPERAAPPFENWNFGASAGK